MHAKIRRFLPFLTAMALVMAFAMASPVLAQSGEEAMGEVVAEGLNGPMGLLVDPDGNIWVIDSGLGGDDPLDVINPETGEPIEGKIGNTARIIKIGADDGAMTEITVVPSVASEGGASGGNRLALVDGTLYATVGEWLSTPDVDAPAGLATIVKVNEDGSTTEVAQFWPYERDVNPYPPVMHAHPYGIIGGPDGNLWVADAGGNQLAVVDPTSGEISNFATFEPLPGVFPRPEYNMELLTDPVPTSVTIGADGELYVSLLSGAPFIPGNAKVLKVASDGTVSDYATGLTMLTDLRTGPDGNLYASQFGIFTETGPMPGSGAVIRVKEGGDSEIVASGLNFVTSLDFNADGDAYVTVNGVGAPGSGQVVKLAALTGAEGMLVSDAMAAMGPPPSQDGAMAEGDTDSMAADSTEEGSMDDSSMAEGDKKDGAMAEGDTETMAEPEFLPVTGAGENAATLLALGLVLLAGGAYAFSTRRRTA